MFRFKANRTARTTIAVRLAATLTVVLAMAALGAATTQSAEAALVNKGCYAYSPGFSTLGQYYKCYVEGDYWTNGVHAYTSSVILKSCTFAGCVSPLSGSFARTWYDSGGRWNPWFCETYNGYFWQGVACTW